MNIKETKAQKGARSRKSGLIGRLVKFFSKQERLLNTGTSEHMDIPPGSHYFLTHGPARIILIDADNQPRTTYIVGPGRHRVTVPFDCLTTVQCANDVQWMIESANVAETLDPTRIEVPVELQGNKAHTDLRFMIDRFMRGHIQINRPPVPEETEEDRNNFDAPNEHPFSRYEQAAYDEDNPQPEEPAQPSDVSPPPGVSPPGEAK